jgi:hypothetical protein
LTSPAARNKYSAGRSTVSYARYPFFFQLWQPRLVNAAAEYGPADHLVRTMAVEQRRWVNATAQTLLCEAGHPDLVAATRVLMALRTGYV